jgi:hypothetical protein
MHSLDVSSLEFHSKFQSIDSLPRFHCALSYSLEGFKPQYSLGECNEAIEI